MNAPKTLPNLTSAPTHYADFCLGLSTTLIKTLTNIFESNRNSDHTPTSDLILSIGSGTGLLEALLAAHWRRSNVDLRVQGVEVSSSVNKYLPEEDVYVVHGTWDVYNFEEGSVGGVMFIYPRDPALVRTYLQRMVAGVTQATGSCVRVVLWLGPRADWDVFQSCFVNVEGFGDVEVMDGCGLSEYEVLMVLKRKA